MSAHQIRIILVSAIFTISGLTTSCINMSSLQTAETLPLHQGRTMIGGGYYMSPSINKDLKDATSSSSLEDIKVPYLEAGYRYGAMEKLEVGAKLTIIGTMGVDAKYQFYDGEKFDLAAGLGIGYLTLESESGSGTIKSKYKNLIIDTIVPFYLSYRMASAFAVYATPKFVYRHVGTTSSTTDSSSGNSTTDKSSSGMSLAGSSLGMMIGKDGGVALEGTYLKDLDSSFNMVQAGFGFFW